MRSVPPALAGWPPSIGLDAACRSNHTDALLHSPGSGSERARPPPLMCLEAAVRLRVVVACSPSLSRVRQEQYRVRRPGAAS